MGGTCSHLDVGESLLTFPVPEQEDSKKLWLVPLQSELQAGKRELSLITAPVHTTHRKLLSPSTLCQDPSISKEFSVKEHRILLFVCLFVRVLVCLFFLP